MDHVKKLSTELQVVLGCTVLLLIFSFLDWQQVSLFGNAYGLSMWHGVGVFAGVLIIAVLVWEGVRLFGGEVKLGTLSEGLISVGLALLLVLFTVITFLTHGTARHWPAWIGLILAIVIGFAAVMRARAEGVEMPEMRQAAASPAAATTSEPASAAPEAEEPPVDSEPKQAEPETEPETEAPAAPETS